MEAVVRRYSEKAFNFIKKETLAQAFSCEFCETSKNTFLSKTPLVATFVTYKKIKLEKWHEPSNKSAITGFYTVKNSKLTGSFSWGCFMRHRLPWFLCCFWFPYFFNRPFCGRPCCKTSSISISCWIRWFPSTNPKELTAFTSPPSTSCTGEQSSSFLCNRWLLVFIHQPFCHVHQIYKRLHYLLWDIFTIHHSRVMHWQPAVFTVLMNWLLGRFVSRQ